MVGEACNRGETFNAVIEKVCQVHFSGRDYCLKRSSYGVVTKELKPHVAPHLELGIIIQATKPALKKTSRKKLDKLEPGEIPKKKASLLRNFVILSRQKPYPSHTFLQGLLNQKVSAICMPFVDSS